MSKFVFFTFNDFSKDGGGVIRMYGILNALAKLNQEVILISNASNYSKFNSNIKHININFKINKFQKRLFQFCIVLPNFITKIIFNKYLQKYKDLKIHEEKLIFFEYLDNSFGYFLKTNKVIKNYINDIHGLAVLEFKYKNFTGIKKINSNLKAYIAYLHDYKVYKNAVILIAVSQEMKDFISGYYKINKNKICILEDGINEELCKQTIDSELLSKLSKEYKNDKSKIIMFIGNFKDLGGVDDLTKAFIQIIKYRDDIKLLLIGDGENYQVVKNLIISNNLENKIFLLGRITYDKLRTYQELADIIVCPDKDHPYSHMLPHIKYFDSLVSGKIVVNGDFKSVRTLNNNDSISLSFNPSDINDLAKTIEYGLNHLEELKNKFNKVKIQVCQQFTYKNFVKNFLYNCEMR